MDQELFLKMKSQGLSVFLTVAIIVTLYWLSFGFINKREWSFRVKYSLMAFLLVISYPLLLLFLHAEMGPGSGIVILFPIIGAAIGYVIGLINDRSTK